MEYFSSHKSEGIDVMKERYEANRIRPGEEFAELYSDYKHDMQRASGLGEVYGGNNEEAIGKKAEALIFSSFKNHESGSHFRLCPTSEYDDFLHGVDLLLEPRNSNIQSLAAVDVTTNQEDVRGRLRANTEMGEARPVGFEKKIRRARWYSEGLANMDPNHARELSSWLEGGGLHEVKTDKNESRFKEVENLFLMKYYKGPNDAPEPNKPGYVIGGPRAVISIDNAFVNRALQGDERSSRVIGDLSFVEFVYCVGAEKQHLDSIVKKGGNRNLFFDRHYSQVTAWTRVLGRPDMKELIDLSLGRNSNNEAFNKQIELYARSFTALNREFRL